MAAWSPAYQEGGVKPKAAPSTRVQRAAHRSVERALAEERLALAAVAKCVLLEVPNPTGLLARLEDLARGAQSNPKASLKLRQSLIDAVMLFKNAMAREMGKPQSLLDPPLAHVDPGKVDDLVGAAHREQQLSIAQGDRGIQDVEAVQRERIETIAAIHDALVGVMREGPASDGELHRRYALLEERPWQAPAALAERRRELVRLGRVCAAGRKDGEPLWALVETLEQAA